MTYFVKILAIVFLAFAVLGCTEKDIIRGLTQGMFYTPPKCKSIEEYEKKLKSMIAYQPCGISSKTQNCIEQYKKNNQNKTPTDKDCPI